MTENVQRRKRNIMADLKKYGLINDNEIRYFWSEDNKLMMKTKSANKMKEDYICYAGHIIEFLNVFRARRKKINIRKKKTARKRLLRIESKIIQRIVEIYSEGCKRFAKDISLWTTFITFCEEEPTLNKSIMRTVKRMLKINSDNEQLFIDTAHWLVNERDDITEARNILKKSLRKHNNSPLLYLEYFRTEIIYTSFLINHDKPISEVYKQVTFLESVYAIAETRISNIEMYIDMLTFAEEYPFTYALQTRIADDIMRKFPNDERAWDIVGSRELEGISNCRDNEAVTEQFNTFCIEQRMNEYFQVYTSAYDSLKSQAARNCYLERLESTKYREPSPDASSSCNIRRNLMMNGPDEENNTETLDGQGYLKYVERMEDTTEGNKDEPQERIKEEKIRKVLNSAIEKIGIANVWNATLSYFITEEDEVKIEQVFNGAIRKLGDTAECLPLWENIIEYYQKKNPSKADAVFGRGFFRGQEISSPLKSMYLEYVAKQEGFGIAFARNFYNAHTDHPPFSLHMHLKMIELERNQPEVNIVKVRNCFEIALTQFGKFNTDLWLNYIKFERDNGTFVELDGVAKRAYCTLDPKLVDTFREKYNIFKLENPF